MKPAKSEMKSVVIVQLLFLLLYFAFALNDIQVLNLYKRAYSGDGTYYGKTENGMCTLNVPHLPSVASRVDALVALNAPQMFGSSSCGICLQVNGTRQGRGLTPIKGTYIVYVKDLCPECKPGDVDFALNGDGRWKISMQAIQCPVMGNIEYKLQGSNNYYIKLQVRNDRMPTTTLLMYQKKQKAWVSLARTRDGFWQFPRHDPKVDRPIQLPLQLLLYAPNGHVLHDVASPPSMGYTGVFYGRGVQYPKDPSLPSA